jgi:Cu/Ag efflux pump CusA
MQSLLGHWRTSLAGIVLISLAVLQTFLNIKVPGITVPDLGTCLTMGLGLIVASDGAAVAGK